MVSAYGAAGAPAVPPLEQDVASVGEIEGLRPRRRPRDGGDVPGADVDLVDALDPQTWRAAAAWLQEKAATATRQGRLQALAGFLRWLGAAEPGLDPLAVTGAHVDAYCDAVLTGAAPGGVRAPGKPPSDATVARKRTTLLAFYAYAWRWGLVRQNRGHGHHQARPAPRPDTVTREERRMLRRGVARLAADGRPAEAAAVALLEGTGAPAAALAALTIENIKTVPDGHGGEQTLIAFHDGRGDLVAFPVPPPARPLLHALRYGRPAGEPLIRRDDGRPVDLEWLSSALTRAALAGGVPEERARALDPHLMRAGVVAELLHGCCCRTGGVHSG
ncbi:hypothetical protein [Nonomuraea pusilla]|uniref:Site-specific recombinase XerD n=1 Tax=Nonomuraea pusilla TaxID=46177 RepID=A0A1H8J5Q7_9ACTN|nr:hypothetical protein [Nonomuraea pusilla]SEN75358.1 Site-specific recombinase XerD [Nonomuraea pusilla]